MIDQRPVASGRRPAEAADTGHRSRGRPPAAGVCMRASALALVAVLAVLAGCATPEPRPALEATVAVYRTMRDAQTVAAGRFGAVPSGLFFESEIVEAVGCADAGAVQVRTASHEVGWAPLSDLPARMRTAAAC